MVLSEAKPLDQGVDSVALAGGEPLGAKQVEALLARAEKLESKVEDRVDFAVRKGSMPPPRTGETIDEKLQKHPGLVLTGNAFKGVSLNDCVVNAWKTAQILLPQSQDGKN